MIDISFATWDHDRTLPIHDGRVSVPGVRIESHVEPTSRLFPLAVGDGRYDVTEMSVSSYVLQIARGEGAYTAIPAFVSRSFRHSGFYARAGSGLTSPADLAGRRVGVPEYQMTAALWMRGILSDDYGVKCEDIHWRTGALDNGVRRERLPLALPDGMIVEPIDEGETLQQLLFDGLIDAVLAPKPPSAFLDGDPRIMRLIPDFETAERDYHARTGFFPIMHLLGVRRTLVDEAPWLPQALFTASVTARDMAMERLKAVWLGNSNRLSLPWFGAILERTFDTMGPAYWSYGMAENRDELAAICRYSVEQHLAPRLVEPEEMFHPSTLST